MVENGSVVLLKIGVNAIAATQNLSLTISNNLIRTTTKGNDFHTYKYGRRRWNGSVKGLVDITDTTGQVALLNAARNGTEISILIGKATPASGDPVYAGAVQVEKHSEGYNEGNESTLDISFRGSGPISQTITS